jgi:hypothetical protein
VIVSEETGQISVAQYGTLERRISPETLRERLKGSGEVGVLQPQRVFPQRATNPA